MTIRKLPADGMWMPYPVNFRSNTPIIDASTLLLSNPDGFTKIAYSFTCPVSGDLDMMEFYADTFTVDVATTLKVSFQDLDANGKPDGTADQYRVITISGFGSAWIQPGLMTSDGTDGGTKRTVTRGQKLACVIEFDTSDPDDVIGFGYIPLNEDTVRKTPTGNFIYDGTWNRWTDVGAMVGALRYDAFQQYWAMPELIPINALGGGGGLNSGTTPDEIGLEFAFQTNIRIGGASMYLSTSVDGAAFDCVLYDHTNTVLETVPMKLYTALFPASGYSHWTVKFSQDHFITANEAHKITVKPSSATTIKLLELSFFDSVILRDTFGYLDTGSNEHPWQHVERTNDGEWTYVTSLPLISLNVTGTDMDAGGATDDWEGDT